MTAKSSVTTFTDLLVALTKEIPYQQMRFNRDFRERLNAFAELFEQVNDPRLRELLRSIAPMASTLDQVEIEASFCARTQSEQVTSLGVRPLNLGFTHRYEYSGYVQNRLEITLVRTDARPGSKTI